jgi:hypothetical protein
LLTLDKQLKEAIGTKIAKLETAVGVGRGLGQQVAELDGFNGAEQVVDAIGPVDLVEVAGLAIGPAGRDVGKPADLHVGAGDSTAVDIDEAAANRFASGRQTDGGQGTAGDGLKQSAEQIALRGRLLADLLARRDEKAVAGGGDHDRFAGAPIGLVVAVWPR